MSAFALPTKLCYLDAAGELDPKNCLAGCDPGWFCPMVQNCAPDNGDPATSPWSLRPEYCPPTISCATKRLGSSFCDEPQGPFEPLLCPPGKYCPDQSTMLTCPAGSYCMRGSTAPTPCFMLSWCPEGTSLRRFYGGVLMCLAMDAALVLLFFFLRDYYEPAVRDARKRVVEGLFGGGGGAREMVEAGDSVSAAATPRGALSINIRTLMRPAVDFVEPLLASSLGAGSPRRSPAQVLETARAAKARLAASFRACNADFRMHLRFNSIKVEVAVRERKEGEGAKGLSCATADLFPKPTMRTLLEDVSGGMEPGKVTAIMGPSGAGKTTLFNSIFGRIPRKRGEMLINDQPREMSVYKKVRAHNCALTPQRPHS